VILELRRWHPDKFLGRFGGRLDPAHRQRVEQRVTETSQWLVALQRLYTVA
jgi:hypothetical protein